MSLRVDYSVLNQRETPSLFADVFSNRPAFGFNGRLFISIDTKQIFRDYGTNWELIADAGSGSSNLQQVCTNGNFTTTDIDMLSGNLILRNLTPGGVLFTNTSEIVSQDINNFFWDDTNNRLGIGTNTPTAPLDVHSSGNILQQLNGTSTNNTYLAFLNQDIGKWRIGNYYNSGDNDFVIYDTFSGVTRAFFTNTGYTILPTNMIIGSSNRSSAYGMDVYVSANLQSTLRVQGASTFLSQLNGTLGVFSTYVQTPQVQASTSAGLSLNANSGTQIANLGAGGGNNATFYGEVTNSYGSTGANFNSNGATTGSVNAYRVSNSVGIGSFGIESNAGNNLMSGGLPNATLLQSISNTTLQFGTLQTARMTITGIGRVGVGTSSPADKFVISNNNAEGMEFGFNTNQSYMFAYNRTTSTYLPFILQQGGGNVLIGTATDNGSKLQVNGNIFSNTGFYGTGNSLTISALNTNYVLKSGAYSGLIVIRDNTNGGSGVWLADPNLGFIQIANNMPGVFTLNYSGNTNIQKNAGGVPINISYTFYSNTSI